MLKKLQIYTYVEELKPETFLKSIKEYLSYNQLQFFWLKWCEILKNPKVESIEYIPDSSLFKNDIYDVGLDRAQIAKFKLKVSLYSGGGGKIKVITKPEEELTAQDYKEFLKIEASARKCVAGTDLRNKGIFGNDVRATLLQKATFSLENYQNVIDSMLPEEWGKFRSVARELSQVEAGLKKTTHKPPTKTL